MSRSIFLPLSVSHCINRSPQSKRIKKLKSFRFATLSGSNSNSKNRRETVKENQLQLEKCKLRVGECRWQVKVNKNPFVPLAAASAVAESELDASRGGRIWHFMQRMAPIFLANPHNCAQSLMLWENTARSCCTTCCPPGRTDAAAKGIVK